MCNVTFSLAILNVSSLYMICVHITHWHLLLVLAFRALWQVNRSGHGCEQDAAGRLRTEVLWLQITIWSFASAQGVEILFINGKNMVGSGHHEETTGGVCTTYNVRDLLLKRQGLKGAPVGLLGRLLLPQCQFLLSTSTTCFSISYGWNFGKY